MYRSSAKKQTPWKAFSISGENSCIDVENQKEGDILLPQGFNQLIMLTAIKDSNDRYFAELPSKVYIAFFFFLI